MEPPRKFSLAGITSLVFTVSFFVTLTTLSSAHHAVDRHQKRRLPSSLPFRGAVGKQGSNSVELDMVALHSSSSAATNFGVPPSTDNVSASVPAACSSTHCGPVRTNVNRRLSIKFRPSLMARGAVPLTDDTYFNFIEANPIVLVLFYAPWCSWSRKTLPEFDSAARVLAKEQSGDTAVLLAKVDCTQNEEVMLQEEIEEFPTLKLFVQARPKVYNGGRQRADILRWVQLNLNQGRTIRSIDSLKEILASRAMGTLVVIAAWGPDPKIAADASASSSAWSSRDVKKANEEKNLSLMSSGISLPQEQKALRSVSQDGEKQNSPVTFSVPERASGPAVTIDRVAAQTEKAPLGKDLDGLQHGDRKKAIHTRHSSHSQFLDASHKATFLHVARLAGSNVIFGEASTPKVINFLMEKYILPHSYGKKDTHIQFPVVAAFPAKVEGGSLGDAQEHFPSEDLRLYNGSLDNAKSMADFVRASKFPLVVPFTEFWAPRIFEDERPVCVLFIDSRSSEVNTPVEASQIPAEKVALLKVAPEFKMRFLFTLAGNSKPHEKRLLTLLGVEDGTSFPQLRIVKFSSQGKSNHYPVVKYRPASVDMGGSARPPLASANREGSSKDSKEGKEVSVDLPRSGTGGLRTGSAAQNIREGLTACRGDAFSGEKGEHERSDANRIEQELKKFLASYLKGSLKPYLRSEPVPSDEENHGALKVLVGSTFEKLVRLSDEDVLVEFGAPWCGHCRKLEPTLRLLAAALRESKSTVVLAKMDATRNEVEGLYFVGYPTLILFPSKRKDSPLIYKGDRTEKKLLEWLSRNVRGDQLDLEQVRKLLEKKKQQPTVAEGMRKPTQINAGLHQPYGPPSDQSVLEEL